MDKATQFAQAFYGGNIPSSQLLSASQSVMSLVTALKNDLRNKAGQIGEGIMDTAILSALGYMASIGVSNPDDYLRQSKLAIKVFNYALEIIRETANRKDEVDTADLSPIRTRILSAYQQWLETAHQEGVVNPKLHAWKNLVDRANANFDMGGYAWYVIHWKIPVDEGFFGTEPFVTLCNSDPSLPDQGKVRMEINGQKWSGKLG